MAKCKKIIWADKKEMVFIPSGKCSIGSENGYSDEKPVHDFETNGFYMDAKLVTNAEFKVFCDSTGRGYPAQPPWVGIDNYFINYPDYPVVNVSCAMCKAYAEWAGKRLPTEEEWEYAARGGKKNTTYPWGETHPCTNDKPMANFADRHSAQPWRDGFADDGYRYTSPVGSYPANTYGLYDMAGNVYQYVDDWYFLYSDTVKSTERFNDGWGGSRVCRGGSYHSPARDLRISRRHQILGGGGNEAVGFRCVSDSDVIPENACAVIPPAKRPVPPPDTFYDDIPTPVGPDKKMELCAGGGPGYPVSGMKKLRHLGFTSMEQYVTWRSCENEGKGKWDFSKWDIEVEHLREAGLKWMPFIIAGPAYSLPQWFLDSTEHHGLCCAEHGIESKVQSFWDKSFYKHIERFFKALSEHYSDHSIFEALLFGISGDFGEAIVSVWHGNWPTATAGTYHAHSGFWCADPYAKADFCKAMTKKYKQIEKLNDAWQTNFISFDCIQFPEMEVGTDRSRIDGFTDEGVMTVEKEADRIRILDFVDWYRSSMTEYVEFWMKTARKYFPDTKLYLCTGGEAQPCHASEFAAQSKACATVGGAVRITNEDSQFERNFCITNWVASACTFYDAEFSFEPAGAVTEKGVVCRIYNAAATGAPSLHFYTGNVLDNKDRRENYCKNIGYFEPGAVKREFALFYPDTAIMFDPAKRGEFFTTFQAMRDFGDYGYVDDLTIKDGILDRHKAVVLTVGGNYRKETLNRLLNFVKNGGLVVGIALDGLYSIGDNKDYLKIFFDKTGVKNIGKGKTLWIDSPIIGKECDDDVTNEIFFPLSEFFEANGIYVPDGKRDRFYTSVKNDGLLMMNYGTKTVERTVTMPNGEKKEIFLAPTSILFEK